MATQTKLRRDLYIDGVWQEAEEYRFLKSPYSDEVIAEIPVASEKEIEMAIEAADRAREKMAAMPAYERAGILEKVVQLFKERQEEAATIIANEAAKPITAAREEIKRTIHTYKFAAEEAKRIYGETLPLDAAPGGQNRTAYTVKKPIGIIGAITPFNFPMNLVAHKVGPAIATGNTVVLKPASQTPLSSYFLADLFHEAGLPAGALNIITGSGKTVGDQLVEDQRIAAITFTGSPSVGLGIRNKAGLKRVTLELGSNAAVVIDQGVPIKKAVSRCVKGAFSFQGQVCISLQRIYVHENIYEEFVEEFVKETRNLKVGNPLDEETDVSALISKNDVKRTLSWLKEAKEQGAEIRFGGETKRNALLPTIVLNAKSSLKVSCEEVFAPIVVINKVASMEEAAKEVNHSKYGLQAGIYTENIHTALKMADKLHVGGVLINDIPTFRVDHMPYGGVKESGTGREGIKYAMEEMLELKLVIFNQD